MNVAMNIWWVREQCGRWWRRGARGEQACEVSVAGDGGGSERGTVEADEDSIDGVGAA